MFSQLPAEMNEQLVCRQEGKPILALGSAFGEGVVAEPRTL
jgi:hypothetical protein